MIKYGNGWCDTINYQVSIFISEKLKAKNAKL
jgi:hypothetical protein